MAEMVHYRVRFNIWDVGVSIHSGVYYDLEFRTRAIFAHKLLKQKLVSNSLTDQLVSLLLSPTELHKK